MDLFHRPGVFQKDGAGAFIEWAREHAIQIENLDGMATDVERLSFLDDSLSDKRIVFLGEEDHWIHEKNEYRLYNTIYRNVGARDYFGIYYLERSHPYSEAVFKEDQAALSKYFREFAAIDLRQSLEDTIRQINLAAASSEQSASAAVEYEVTRLTDPDTLTIDDIPLLKKIKTKDLQAVLDKYFNQPPRCWILVHSNYQDGGDRDATSRK